MITLDQTALWNLMNRLSNQPVQVGWLRHGYRQPIGAKTPIVWLTLETIDHVALGRHGQRYYQDLCLTPSIIWYGECRHIEKNMLAFVLTSELTDGKPYKSVIKSAAVGAEVYLHSTYRIQKGQARRLLDLPPIARW